MKKNATKLVTVITCALIVMACLVAEGFMIWHISQNLPRTIMEIIGSIMALVMPGVLIYINVVGLYSYLGNDFKKIATIFACILIVLACCVAMGYTVWQIYTTTPSSIIEWIGYAMILAIPGLINYVTIAGLYEYLKN